MAESSFPSSLGSFKFDTGFWHSSGSGLPSIPVAPSSIVGRLAFPVGGSGHFGPYFSGVFGMLLGMDEYIFAF